jgi:hypothetical protein
MSKLLYFTCPRASRNFGCGHWGVWPDECLNVNITIVIYIESVELPTLTLPVTLIFDLVTSEKSLDVISISSTTCIPSLGSN